MPGPGYDRNDGEKYDDGPQLGSTRPSTIRSEYGDDVPDAGPLQLAQEDSLAEIERLHMLIAKLRARLAPVLLPACGMSDDSEMASNTVKEAKPATSYLRTREEGIRLGVVRAQMEVDRLIELLDV